MKGHRLLGKEFFFAVLATVFTVSVTFAASPENTPADRYRAVVKISKTGTVSVSKNEPVTENANKTGNVTAADEGDSTDSEGRVPVSATDRTEKIGVNLASRILTFYQGSDKVAMYPVGVGSIYTPTPIGYYTVENKETDPTWINPDDTSERIASGRNNPLGYRLIGFSGNYGIHGTNRPETVGGYVSNGCIRMREADVEDLYERVHVGTAVEVYYDRIVIDVAPDHRVSYYIYPDGYDRQPLSVSDVKRALAGYGVDPFEEEQAILQKINASAGMPTYVAEAYDLYIDGKKQPKRVLGKDGKLYLPAQILATALGCDLMWNNRDGVLTTSRGKAPGIVRSGILYVDDLFVNELFPLNGMLKPNLIYDMKRTNSK